MKKLLACFFILMTTLSFAQDIAEDQSKQINVVLGIDYVQKLEFDPSTKVQVGNESILTYQIIPQKKEITFKGQKPGDTSVIIRNTVGDIKARYLVRVTASSQSKTIQELKDFLGDVEGLEIGVKGESTVFVGGKIVVPSDIGRVVIILEKYPEVVSLVELSPLTQKSIAKKMQEEIQKNSAKDVTVRVVNGLYWLEGVVGSEAEKERALQIARAYLPDKIENLARRTDSVQQVKKDIIQNFVSVNEDKKKQKQPDPKQIKITAQFVELTKNYNKIFGFKWTPLMSGDGGSIQIGKTTDGGVTTRSDGSLQAAISNLFPKLASAKSAGHARVIQSGVIIVQDKVAGSIQKSSKKPFAIGTGEFTKSDSAEAGFNLNVTPTVLEEEKIKLDLGVSVSSAMGSPPETLSNSVKTTVTVKSKESAVVGGVVINKSSTDYDTDAPFGQQTAEGGTPLFSFLRSKAFLNNKSQFVVFITPEIIESASEGTDEIKMKFKRRAR